MTDQVHPGAVDELPEWDLADLYSSPDSPVLATDLDNAERDARAFLQRWKGKLAAAGGKEFGRAIESFEEIS